MSSYMSRTKQIPETSRQIQSELFTLTYGVLVAQLLEDIEDTSVINQKLDKIGYNIGVRLIDDIFSRNLTLKRCKDLTDTADAIVNFGFKPYLNMTPKIENWSEKKDEFSIILENNVLTEFVELNEIDVFREQITGVPSTTFSDKNKNSSQNENAINQKNHNHSNITIQTSSNPTNTSNLSPQQQQFNQNLLSSITNSTDPAVISQAMTELELDDNSISTKGLNYCQMLCGAIRGALEMVQIQVHVIIINDSLRPNCENFDIYGSSVMENYKHATQLRVKFIRKIEEAMPVGDA